MNKYLHYLLFSFLSLHLHSVAQSDTAHQIPTVMIRTYRITPPATEQFIDSLAKLEFATKGLHQLLEYRSNVLVKNYGVSALSTISIRGSSAAQTSVKWQGLNINNAMTGITDFSNLPVGLFDDIRIHYGDHPSQRSLSGSIDLENRIPASDNKYSGKLLYSFESTGNHTFGIQQSFHQRKIANTLKLFVSNEQNKFTYYNTIRDSMQTLAHAHRKSKHVMNDLYYQVNAKHSISWHTWFSSMLREIPAANFEVRSNKLEDIQSIRSLLKWKYRKNSFYQLESSLGYVQENYHYQDPDVNLNTQANVTQIPFQCLASMNFPKQQTLQVELNSAYSFLHSQQQHDLVKAGIQLNYGKSFFTYRLSVKTYVQKEVSNLFEIPMSIGLQAVYRLPLQTDIYATISQTNRTPTLNELYYNPGGNKNLRPEKSNNLELGTRIHHAKPRTKWNAEISSFNRQVSNWIVWYGNSILTPQNISKVQSYGVEAQVNFSYLIKKPLPVEPYEVIIVSKQPRKESNTKFISGLFYAYTIATTQSSLLPNDYSIGKQIPYIPRYQFKWNTGLQIKQLQVTGSFAYTGYRFVTTDETQYLKPYTIMQLDMRYKLLVRNMSYHVNFTISNLLNTHYESIIGRVMPGRTFTIGLQTSWN